MVFGDVCLKTYRDIRQDITKDERCVGAEPDDRSLSQPSIDVVTLQAALVCTGACETQKRFDGRRALALAERERDI